MKKSWVAVLVLLGVVVVLAVTNPKMADYKVFIKQQVVNSSQKDSTNTPNPIGGLVGAFAGAMVDSVTTRDNYFVCSVYDTRLGTSHVVYLGLLGQFLKLSSGS